MFLEELVRPWHFGIKQVHGTVNNNNNTMTMTDITLNDLSLTLGGDKNIGYLC